MSRKKEKTEKKKRMSFLELISAIGKTISAITSIIFIIIFLFFFLSFIGFGAKNIKTGNVAVIQLNGPITATGGDSLMGKGVKSDDILNLIENAEEDKGIKAIVFEINSPGGGPVASDEIASAIKACKKPTVSLIREIGASGGFWIATAADRVFANRMSITGSIGATSSKLAFPELIKEYNVTYRRLVAGKHKDAGTIWRKLTPEEKKMFQDTLKFIQDEFIKAIAKNRKMKEEDVRKHADGFIFTGKEALEYGFVDELGNKADVKKYLEGILKTKVKFKKLSTKKGLADFIGEIISENSFELGKGIGAGLTELSETNNKNKVIV